MIGMGSERPAATPAWLMMALVLATIPGPLWADPERAYELSHSGEILPLGSIMERARSVAPGTLLEAELEPEAGGYVYEIELATPEGRHLELHFDARTGDLIGRD